MINKKRKDFHKDIEGLINDAAECIATGNLHEASDYLDQALQLDFNHYRVLTGLQYLKFWGERLQSLSQLQDAVEYTGALLRYWKKFKEFTAPLSNDAQLIQSLRHFIFSQVLKASQDINPDGNDHESQLWQGIAFKGMGNYDDAQKCFSRAMQSSPPNARLLSELADTCALVGEDQKARALFREAFYIDPQGVDIDGFDSELFVRLISRVRAETGFESDLLREWIPVYGTLWRILNIKRELRALEYGKLRQHIFNYEQEYKESKEKEEDKSQIILPRLLNHYFWLIDYLVVNREDQYKIDDILLKIRTISLDVYKLYTN